METFAEWFPQFALRVFAPALGVCLAAWALYLLAPTVSRPLKSLRGSACAGLAVLALVCASLCGKNTNGVNGVGGPPAQQLNTPSAQFGPPLWRPVTAEDISNGWRMSSETDVAALAPPPAGAVTNERWRLRGAHDDAFRIQTNGWTYPFASGVTVLSLGEIRMDIRSRGFPRPFEEDLSLLPLSGWPLLPEGHGESVFWHAATPSNSLLATWWNAAYGRDESCPTNFQAELFPDGRFEYRYDDRTVVYAPVFPFDWDSDGLENSVDPDPLVAGPDAHGTNAEWYNVVCSNVLAAAEGVVAAHGDMCPPNLILSPRTADVNTNAYYFVEVVTELGPAPIYFTADRESRLGSPVVVAIGGVTNYVPLLMGIEYAVTSTVPIAVSVPSNAVASIAREGDCRAFTVTWPLAFNLFPADSGYSVEVEPFDPGCEYSWASSGGNDGGAGLLGGGACSYSANGKWIGFVGCIAGDCGCGGCSIFGTSALEGATFALPHVWCGCSAFGHGGTNGAPAAASVSVAFDKPVVFYEDAYTNSPGDVVAKHSSSNALSISANGGENGGMLTLSAQNIDRLNRIGGADLSFPYMAMVPPYGSVSFEVVYETTRHSDAEGDIEVEAMFTEHTATTPLTQCANLTSVRFDIEAFADFPSNKHRHVFGPQETAILKTMPLMNTATWHVNEITTSGTEFLYTAPGIPTNMPARISISSSEYAFVLSVIAPIKLEVISYEVASSNIWIGNTGTMPSHGEVAAGMVTTLRLLPLSVSFRNLYLKEGECSATNVWGIFTPFAGIIPPHDSNAGAWDEMEVGAYNNYAGRDTALLHFGNIDVMWISGGFQYNIPNYWYIKDANGDPGEMHLFKYEPQIIRFYANGDLSIEKYGCIVTRGTNDISTITQR